MPHHADPRRRTATAAALAAFTAEGCPPKCRACGKPIKAGDYVDPHHPYCHAGNLHLACDDTAPEARRT